MTTEEIPYFEDEQSKLIPNEPIVERNTINAIIYDPKTDEILCLDWEKFGWHTLIIGGIEDGEDPIAAAEREITEETGYKNIKFISEVGKTRSGYYAAHKKENRVSNATGFLFELLDDTKVAVDEAEVANHVFKWVPKKDVGDFINLTSQKYIWEKAEKLLV